MCKKLLMLLIIVLMVSLGTGCSVGVRSEVAKVNCCDGSVKEFSLIDHYYIAKNEGIYFIDRTSSTQHFFSYEQFNNIEWQSITASQ